MLSQINQMQMLSLSYNILEESNIGEIKTSKIYIEKIFGNSNYNYIVKEL